MIVVAGGAGIDDAVRTLKKLSIASTANVAKDKRFIVTGYASAPGDVKGNASLVAEATNLGRQLVQSLL
jgi:hypothetical protein